MSKIGKKNIVIPKESSIKIDGGNLTISGPKGTKKLTINDKIFTSKLNESEFKIHPLEKKIDKKETGETGSVRLCTFVSFANFMSKKIIGQLQMGLTPHKYVLFLMRF